MQLQFFHWPCLFPFDIVHMRCLIKVCRVNTNIMSSYPKNVRLTMLPSHATVGSPSLCGQASENTALHFPNPLPFWVPALLLLQGVQGATCQRLCPVFTLPSFSTVCTLLIALDAHFSLGIKNTQSPPTFCPFFLPAPPDTGVP